MDSTILIETGLANQYGELQIVKERGKCRMQLGDCMGLSVMPISEELFQAFAKEFQAVEFPNG